MESFYVEIYYIKEKHTLKSWEIAVWRLTTVTLCVCAAWWAPACHIIKDCFVWFILYFLPQSWYSIQGTRWMLCSEWAAIQYSYPPHTMCHPVPYLRHSVHTLCWIKNCWTPHAVALITAGTECSTNVSEMLWNEVVSSSLCGCWRGKCHQRLKLKLSKGTSDFICPITNFHP